MQQLATAGEQAAGSRRRGKTFAATLIALLPACLPACTLCRALGLKNELVVLAKLPELHFHSCGYAYLDRQGERGKRGSRGGRGGIGRGALFLSFWPWLLALDCLPCLALLCLPGLASLNVPRKSFTIDKPRQLFAFASAAQAATVNFMQ